MSKWFRRKKLVFEVRDLWPKGGIELGKLSNSLAKSVALGFEKLIYTNSDLVVTCSSGMESGVKEVVENVKTLVIPNSSDVSLFSSDTGLPQFPNGFDSDLPIFVYAGSLGLMDDCGQILKGIKAAIDLELAFVFIGDGAEKEFLQLLTKEYGLEKKVWFLGLIPKVEVVKWLQQARASFVTFKDLPVLHTSSPNKMFDSFAAGVPIIQSTRGWIAELVRETECGINVDPNHPEDIATALRLFVQRPELAKKMGENALQLAKSEFSRDHLSQKFLRGIQQIQD
jgi:glycosyltransferase involved in cell wall biosynthesis